MDRGHETTALRWGTLEELLLASAVSRHGTDNWEAVAVEVRSRTPAFPSLTSQNCLEKFNDLKRRYMLQNDTGLVEVLRRIRVEELRREVQQRDVSIVSLELKLKRLEEERERRLKEEADLQGEKQPSPEKFAGKSAGGDDSGDDRDDRSFNESNSTTQQKAETTAIKQQNDTADEDGADAKPDMETKREGGHARTDSDTQWKRGWSHNGKLEEDGDDNNADRTQTEKKAEMEIKPGREGLLGESNELGESVGESKREEKERQNSDVQSSVSLKLKRKKRRRKGGEGRVGAGVGSSSGEEPDGGEEVSRATKRMPAAKSEPLVKLLGIIRSHRLGSMFERRLRSQESERYKSLIRQHIDLRTIQSRLDKGIYSNCVQKFFRDLLLLFNNAIIFFRKKSPESLAAYELRGVVGKEMRDKLGKSRPQPVTIKLEPKEQPISFSTPNKSSSTIVVCGKRSSMRGPSENASKKGDSKDKEVEEKKKLNEKKKEGSLLEIEEKSVIGKKRVKERLVSGKINSTTSSKNGETKHQYGGNELSSHDALEMKVDRRENATKKKQGAASFLKRMKQNSPSSEDTENEDDDNDVDSSEDESKEGKGKEDQRGRGRNNRDGNNNNNRGRVTRSSRGRGAREESGRAKKGIGRPLKRQEVISGGTGKRGRNNGDSEVLGVVSGSGGRARKRLRR